MLYTDADFVTQDDLVLLDGETPDVAQAEQIAIDGDSGIGRRACDECGKHLLSVTQSFSGSLGPNGSSSSHLQAVLNAGGAAVSRPRFHLGQVVVSNVHHPGYWSWMKDWVAYEALVKFYRACFNRRASDRYEGKLKGFQDEARVKWQRVMSLGIPLVIQPLPCPGAKHEFGSGVWDAGNLSSVAGGATAETQYYVAITYADSSAYVAATDKGNAESGPSEILAFTVELNKLLKIDITSLSPPDAAPPVGAAQGAYVRLKATHWNVYVGSVKDKMYLQNAAPVAIATKTYTLAGAPVLSGNLLVDGQYPDANYFIHQTVNRA